MLLWSQSIRRGSLLDLGQCFLRYSHRYLALLNRRLRFYSSHDGGIPLRTLIPIGSAGPTGTYVSGVRELNNFGAMVRVIGSRGGFLRLESGTEWVKERDGAAGWSQVAP